MPLSTRVPLPALVIPREKTPSPITPPTVSVVAALLVVMVGVVPRVTAPLPRSMLSVPVKVKLPFQFCALLLAMVSSEPLVLSMVVPAPIVSAPLPRAESLPSFRVPLLSVVPPV